MIYIYRYVCKNTYLYTYIYYFIHYYIKLFVTCDEPIIRSYTEIQNNKYIWYINFGSIYAPIRCVLTCLYLLPYLVQYQKYIWCYICCPFRLVCPLSTTATTKQITAKKKKNLSEFFSEFVYTNKLSHH
eukprot:GHVR01094199.1.p1 GENE.GHVR01094199.1~~GHVR01094199.1.p1  ORF type:complete len:129 (-),score=2.02 GHVR01094199.1:23-409(-)